MRVESHAATASHKAAEHEGAARIGRGQPAVSDDPRARHLRCHRPGVAWRKQRGGDALLDFVVKNRAEVPALGPVEITNILSMAKRRGRITAAARLAGRECDVSLIGGGI